MRVGFGRWRGMVGSVLMERMASERDFDLFKSRYLHHVQPGGRSPGRERG